MPGRDRFLREGEEGGRRLRRFALPPTALMVRATQHVDGGGAIGFAIVAMPPSRPMAIAAYAAPPQRQRAPNGKGGRRFRQPPVSPDFWPRAGHRGSARLYVGGMLCPLRQGLRASRSGHRSANHPMGGHRGGRDPEGPASHLDVLAPPLPCGASFAVRSSKLVDPEGSSRFDVLARSVSLRKGATFRAVGHPA